MRLLASDPGHVTVKLVVSFEDGRPAITDSITVQVRFKILWLLHRLKNLLFSSCFDSLLNCVSL